MGDLRVRAAFEGREEVEVPEQLSPHISHHDESILPIEDEDKFDLGRHCSQDLNLEGLAKRTLASASSSGRRTTLNTDHLSPII